MQPFGMVQRQGLFSPVPEPPFAGLAYRGPRRFVLRANSPGPAFAAPQTPDQCDAPHNRRKPSMIAALAQKIAFRSRLARYKGTVHYERSC